MQKNKSSNVTIEDRVNLLEDAYLGIEPRVDSMANTLLSVTQSVELLAKIVEDQSNRIRMLEYKVRQLIG